MLLGFKICCPALYYMLSGFKNMLPGLKMSCVDYPSYYLYLSVFVTLEKDLYFLPRLAGAITRTAPFQTLLGVGSAKQPQR